MPRKRMSKVEELPARPASNALRKRILGELRRLYPEADCALDFATAFQLLVATILSAQCTDKTVNLVTPKLFSSYPDPLALAKARQESVEGLIYSTGFYRNKAKNLRNMAKKLMAEFDGEVPKSMDELLSLPGVARKTANVVLGTAFGLCVGVVVDTHVARLSRRFAFTKQKDPVKIENELMGFVPKKDWIWLSHGLIQHGRLVCDAKRPRCEECSLASYCPSVDLIAPMRINKDSKI